MCSVSSIHSYVDTFTVIARHGLDLFGLNITGQTINRAADRMVHYAHYVAISPLFHEVSILLYCYFY